MKAKIQLVCKDSMLTKTMPIDGVHLAVLSGDIANFLAGKSNVRFKRLDGRLPDVAISLICQSIVDSELTEIELDGFQFKPEQQQEITRVLDERINSANANRLEFMRRLFSGNAQSSHLIDQVRCSEKAEANYQNRLNWAPRVSAFIGMIVWFIGNRVAPVLSALPLIGFFFTLAYMADRRADMRGKPYNNDENWEDNTYPDQLAPQERNAMLAGVDAQRSVLHQFGALFNKDAWNTPAYDKGWDISATNDQFKLKALGK